MIFGIGMVASFFHFVVKHIFWKHHEYLWSRNIGIHEKRYCVQTITSLYIIFPLLVAKR